MLQKVLDASNLPNLHPAILHFPIVLFCLALAVELLAIVWRRRSRLDTAAVILFLLAALAAVVTYFSGRSAANSLGPQPPKIQEAIAAHSDMALRTVWAFVVLAVLRGLFEIIRTKTSPSNTRVLRGLLLLVAFFGFWLLLETADRGGGLVYTYGVSVKAAAASSSPATAQNESAGQSAQGAPTLKPNEKGAIVWAPAASDPSLLPASLQIIKASPNATVRAEKIEGQDKGVNLLVSGRVVLLLPEKMGDVVLSLDTDPSKFAGSLGLVHHYRATDSYEAVVLFSQGEGVLQSVTNGNAQTLDQKQVDWPQDRSVLAASAAGRHLMGYVDGMTVLHGHRDAVNFVGKVGVVCDGTGSLEIFELRAAPASSEAEE
jgi:uncharacterized membrane protein